VVLFVGPQPARAVVGQFGNQQIIFFAELCVWLSDLCDFACISDLTAKYAKDFAKIAKQSDHCLRALKP
jgi:hypothetical protein